MESSLALWKEYKRLEIFHVVAAEYTRFYLVPTLLSCSVLVIVAVFVCIRAVGLPWWLYLFFVSSSLTVLFLTFWLPYQLVLALRASEDIVGVLTSIKDVYSAELSWNDRKYLAKKARATRTLGYRTGDFGNFSLDVPVVMWDEILNQLLFLLSL